MLNLEIARRFVSRRHGEQGVALDLPVYSLDAWQRLAEKHEHLVQNIDDLSALIAAMKNPPGKTSLFPAPMRWAGSETIEPKSEFSCAKIDCRDDLRGRIYLGLGNPNINDEQRESIIRDLDPELPTFEPPLITEHFELKWTKQSTNPEDCICDENIVHETASYLEEAWSKYCLVFTRTPYIPPGRTKIQVIFRDLDSLGQAEPPDGPIQFNASSWQRMPGIRRPTSAHELFHKLQYAFGYRTSWMPEPGIEWFSEGTASFAEAWLWNAVSDSTKLSTLFNAPFRSFWYAGALSLPFWIYFHERLSNDNNNAVLQLLEAYAKCGNAKKAFQDVLLAAGSAVGQNGQMMNLFSGFSEARLRESAWNTDRIIGPDGLSIQAKLLMKEVTLCEGQPFCVDTGVQNYGANYYRFRHTGMQARSEMVCKATMIGGEAMFVLVSVRDKKIVSSECFTPPVMLSRASNDLDWILIVIGTTDGAVYNLTTEVKTV